MIVVDASALVAIAQAEPEEVAFLAVLQESDRAWLSPINYVETGLILARRKIIPDQPRLERWLASVNVRVSEDAELAVSALDAYLRYGKGFHPARLNLADCFAYALAKQLDLPLLYKGDDFAKTDIRSAI